MKEKKKKKEKQPNIPAKPGQCDNCDGTGLVTYKKLNPATKRHEQIRETCIVCEGSGEN